MSLFRLENVSKTFGPQTALFPLSFTLEQKDHIGVIGESGSGKSTLAKLLLGFEKPSTGSIQFEDQPLEKVANTSFRKRCQIIFQNPLLSFHPFYKLNQALHEPLRIHFLELPHKARQDKINAFCEALHLPEALLQEGPQNLSGGQLQRFGLLRTLLVEPEVLICDEPISALDPTTAVRLLQLLKSLQDRITLFFIGHNLASVAAVSEHILVLLQGHLIEQGRTKDVFDSPAHPYTKRLLAAARFKAHDEKTFVGVERSSGGCPFVGRCSMELGVCKEVMPELRGIEGGHRVACHAVQCNSSQ
jgi:oligopeptide/dipeptide ABC transporter ATP-binding protein